MNIERLALEHELDHADFAAYVAEREKFDGDQWEKDKDFRSALRKHMGVDTATRRKANEGKQGYEEFHDAQNALSGNVAESDLIENLGHDVQDWDSKAYDIAIGDHSLKPGAHDEEWLRGVLKDYRQQLAQSKNAPEPEPQYDDVEQFDDFGSRVPFARPRRGVERNTWRAEWIETINRVLQKLR